MRKLVGIILMCVGIVVFLIPEERVEAEEKSFYFSEETRSAYEKEECVTISKEEDFSSWHTFDSFPLVKEVRIEEGTKKLGDYIFFCFPNVEKIVLPASLSDLGSAFYPHADWGQDSEEDYCLKKLKSIEVSRENIYYTAKDGALYTRGYRMLICYPAGSSKDTYWMPEFTSEIAIYAFGYNPNLKKIVLGTRFVVIEGESFSRYGIMPNLNTIQVASDNATLTAEDGVLFDYQKSTLLIFPNGKKADTYKVPETVTCLSDRCLQGAEIGKLVLPKKLVCDLYGGELAFMGNQVKEFVITGNATLQTKDGVLYNKEGTEMIAWPGGKKTDVLSFPSTLVTLKLQEESIPCIHTVTKLIIPAAATDIWLADNDMNSLKTIEVEKGNENFVLYDDLLYSKDLKRLCLIPLKSQKKSITIPAEYEYTGYYLTTDSQMKSVTTITINGNGLYVPYELFPNLETIKIGKGNKKAKVIDGVLYSATKKTLIWYPQQKKDKSFTIPNTVIKFSDGAFSVQKYIQTVTLPKNLDFGDALPERWFKDCPKLKAFKVDSGSKYLMAKNGVLYSKDGTSIIRYPQAKTDANYSMPDTVKIFYVCGGNDYLTSISFGKSFEGFNYEDWSTQQSLMQFTKLNKLTVSKKNPMLYIKDNVLYRKSDYGISLMVYPLTCQKQSFTIPAEVTDFWECKYIFLKHPYLMDIRSDNPDFHIFGKEIEEVPMYR